ncbi:MAG: response regulator [Halomonadaceae bacterium]|nr:MAG: response regulator [Halomonadaceae bacterium]
MASNLLLIYGALYALLLIALAWLAEQSGRWPHKGQAMLYGLSLGVYCSSWTFLGAVGNADSGGWSYLPIYLGPILLFLFGWPFIRRLLLAGSRNRVTSIADFIGSRFGKDQRLAATVTLVAVIATLPYIALQLRGIALAWSSATATQWDADFAVGTNASFFAALFLAWFAITFGTRIIDGSNRHRGLLTVVAIESVVKLFAFLALGLFATWYLFDSPEPLTREASAFSWQSLGQMGFYSQILISAMAIVCLPRQFHVMVVEYHDENAARWARWLFPLYLALFAIAVIPLVEAGRMALGNMGIPSDSYVLALPAVAGQSWLTLVAFVGALSAATAMVLVATIALSLMISNELILPLYLRLRNRARNPRGDLGNVLRLVRRGAIIAILIMGWMLEQSTRFTDGLSYMGLLAFTSSAQLMPAIVSGLYWSGAHRHGVLVGLLAGTGLWFYCLLFPVMAAPDHPLLVQGPWGLSWLAPENLFHSGALMDPLTHGIFWSLLANVLCLVLISRRSRLGYLDRRQARAFMELSPENTDTSQDFQLTNIDMQQLHALIRPLLGDEQAELLWKELEQRQEHRILPQDRAPRYVVQTVESRLASIIGATSAHRAITLLERQVPLQMEDLADLMGGTSEQLQFSRHLLQTTMENLPQGISVVDRHLRLVAWNGQYERLFDYPARLLYIGCPIARIYEFNADRGLLSQTSGEQPHEAVERRLQMLRSGQPYRLERHLPGGGVIEIRGKPIPTGGYITAYNDVSDYHQVMSQLEESRATLEQRVQDRTAALSEANRSLQEENRLRALIEKELQEVHASKSRFLAGASHDLLQPINAARLLSSALTRQQGDAAPPELKHIDSALASAETLISHLREISRLDSGHLEPDLQALPLNDLLQELIHEFRMSAEAKGIRLRFVPCRYWIRSDPHLLRRVLQNFLSNALNYTRTGSVLLGCRRQGDHVSIQVWDSGSGIQEKDQQRIFVEFERLHNNGHREVTGLGLGLPIAMRIARLLKHALECHSVPGKGSLFSLTVPITKARPKISSAPAELNTDPQLQQLSVLCIDNEPHLLAGLQALLTQFGCRVTTATTLGEAMQHCPRPPDLIIADYHLDHGETGLALTQALTLHWQQPCRTLIISADDSDPLRQAVADAGLAFLAKPVEAASLRLSLRRLLRRQA